MYLFEAIMLLCFGASWPVSVAKSIRTRHVDGKSPLFMALVALGYISGIIHKVTNNFDWVTALYAFNLFMVLLDLSLYVAFNHRKARVKA